MMARDELTLTQEDWTRFMTPEGLTEKCGVPVKKFREMILKELMDNACDVCPGATATILFNDAVKIEDWGPGIDLDLFSIKRPLQSSKHWRTGKRGALGNGLRAVMGGLHVLGGHLQVETSGRIYRVCVDAAGDVTPKDIGPGDKTEGTTIIVHAPDIARAHWITTWATSMPGGILKQGSRPSPHWFDVDAIRDLQRSATGVTVGEFVGQFGTRFRPTNPRDPVTGVDAGDLLADMELDALRPPKVRAVGDDTLAGSYAVERGSVDGVPFVVEVWAAAARDEGDHGTWLLLNRTYALGHINLRVHQKGRLNLSSGHESRGLTKAEGRDDPGRTLRSTLGFRFTVSVSSPFVPILSSGKAPDLTGFAPAILRTAIKAGRKAQNGIGAKPRGTTIKAAVYDLLESAYDEVSDGGRYWANARQLMYAMRPDILRLTGRPGFSDATVTQVCVPAFLDDNPELTRDWRIAYDNRGSLIEPHTRGTVGLGTAAVHGYTSRTGRVTFDQTPAVDALVDCLPEHRFAGLLFVEKEGFHENILASGLLEQHDLGLVSSKGMSVIALRALIDEMAGRNPDFTLYTLTDFDVTGQTIRHTLTSDTPRYRFNNPVRVKHLGIDWPQAQALHAAGRSEPVDLVTDHERKDALLASYGLHWKAIDFLLDDALRVELNALTSRAFLTMIEDGLTGSPKICPPDEVLADAWRELRIQAAVARAEAALRAAPRKDAPDGLAALVAAHMAADPSLSWDAAIADLAGGGN